MKPLTLLVFCLLSLTLLVTLGHCTSIYPLINNVKREFSPVNANYYFACNLGGDRWLAIVNQPCSTAAVLTVPPNTRMIVTGTVTTSCGTYSTVFVNDVNAGYVEQQYLCKPRLPLIRGDEVGACNMPASWDFLNLFRAPYTNQTPVSQFRRYDRGVVVDGPAYNNQIYMVKVYNRNLNSYGWVDAGYVCQITAGKNQIPISNKGVVTPKRVIKKVRS